ncbi:aminotransferase class I/II-fold pyridoxal phosphate-dependent enzyme [Ruegeria sp.]|uniref:aminotransferase class I/II-fold pyridoxal phosphate-dependent enzyme n=1 Tax=Ruegeria sp. TaxID=1879320 RepID=UPI003C7ADA31
MKDSQMSDFRSLIRPEINDLPDYNAGLALDRFRATYGIDCVAKLDSNENPHGPSPRAIAAIEAAATGVARYPDAGTLALRQAIGTGYGLPAERVVMGNGSEDLIGAIFRAVLRPGDHVVTICPSFGLHEFGALACGATVSKLPFNEDWSFPIDGIVDALADKPRVLMFSSPSNPAGPAITSDGFDRILAGLDPETLFVFDEAYVEFLSDDAKFNALERLETSNLPWISLRTFSKAYGLAGVRVGYALCANEVLAKSLLKTRNPFGVNALAVVAAHEAFADVDHLEHSTRATMAERGRLYEEMTKRGYSAAPSHTNFLFFDCGESGAGFAEKLRHKGVLIKGWLEQPYENWARVTIGTPEQNNAFLNALDSLKG